MEHPATEPARFGDLSHGVALLDPIFFPPFAFDVTVATHAVLTHPVFGGFGTQPGTAVTHPLHEAPQRLDFETAVAAQFSSGALDEAEVEGRVE